MNAFDWIPPVPFLQMGPEGSRDYLTLVHTAKPCGKHVTLGDDGKDIWSSHGDEIAGKAITVHVPDAEAMEALLKALPPNFYVIPDFIATAGHEPFGIMVTWALNKALGKPENHRPAGLQKLPNHALPVCSKLKENFTPGSWRLFDFDRDEHTPEELRNLTVQGAITRLEEAIPGLKGCARVVALSSKGRVLKDGKPLSESINFHMWVKAADPDLTDQFRQRLLPRLAAAGLGWKKPRGDKLGPAALIDPSVWAVSRCVYAGAPGVGEGLSLGPADVLATDGGRFALASLQASTDAELETAKSVFGIEWHGGVSGSFRDTTGQLAAETVVELKRHKPMKLAEFMAESSFKHGEKYRCQTPFRNSDSWNAILRKYEDGRATVYDNGTGVLYVWPDPLDGLDVEAEVDGKAEPGAAEPEVPHGEERPRGESGESLAAVIDRLAKLPPLQYDRVRTAEAKRLVVRIATLDVEVAAARKRMGLDAADEDGKQGKPIEFEEVEPWPSPVDGAQLLDDLAEVFERLMLLPPYAPEALALWALFTYLLDAADTAPLLVLSSPVKRCGKTRLIELLTRLVHRPMPTNNITPAALFRVIGAAAPCLLFDELDALLESDKTGEIRGLLNAGHTRATAQVIRTVGEDFEPRAFTVWCPKVLALIGSLERQWSTVADRAVLLAIQRKPTARKLPSMRRAGVDFGQLRSRIARWAADHADALRASEPLMPEGLNDRAADNWRILVAIGDAAGGPWPQKARETALGLSGGEASVSVEADGVGVRLLSDIRGIFGELGSDRVSTDELVQKLAAIDDPEASWDEWNRKANWGDQRIKPRQIAGLLKPFGIKPSTIRLSDGSDQTAKGYLRKNFEEAFRGYLTPEDPSPPGGW